MHSSRLSAAVADRVRTGRVLLVEDDEDAALFVTHVLTRQGAFDVTHTADPAAALALAVAEPWDLVLTDLDLPVMPGLELAAALRRCAPGVPVALVTAQPPAAWPAPDVLAGLADAILSKPVPVDALLATAMTLAGLDRPAPRGQ